MGIQAFKARRDTTVKVMLDALTQIGSYAELDHAQPGMLPGELRFIVTRTLELASTNEPMGDSELDFFRNIGQQRGRARFPLRDVRAGFQLSYIAGLRDMFDTAGTGNHADLMDLTAYGSHQHPKMLEATVRAYSETLGRTGGATEVRTFMVQQLLEGQTVTDTAQGFGIQLPQAMVLLVCHTHLAEPTTQQRLLDRHLRAFPGALWRSDPRQSECVVLLPAEQISPSVCTSMADDVTRAMTGLFDQQVHVVRARVDDLGDLPTAYERARVALSVIGAMPDVADRSYSANELLVELAVAHQEPLRSGLMDLLAPLQGGKDLLRTLEALYANNLDREQTARKLYIHRRTLTYRLNRIRELSGIDAATPHGVQLLRLALTASNLNR